MTYYLTKSDYKLARSCAAKLYYQKHGYPRTDQQDAYLLMLADTGYMLEELVRLQFPDGQTVPDGDSQQAAFEQTMALLQSQQQLTLFEATCISTNKLARIDILVRDGNNVALIEIKSKSSKGPPDFWTSKGTLRSEWRLYVEDVAFQQMVLQECFPEWTITPFLALVDSSTPVMIDQLWSLFVLQDIQFSHGYTQRRVEIVGGQQQLRELSLMQIINVAREVQTVLPEVQAAAESFSQSLSPLRRLPAPLTAHCQQCEFRHDDPAHSGFHECWRELAHPVPHLLDLYRVAEAGGRSLAQQLIEAGRVQLFDVPVEKLQRKDGSWGAYGQRQRVQIEYTQRNQQWIDPGLAEILHQCSYPIHFMDFETARFALPTHAGLRPYATEAFLWSCHRLDPKGTIDHAEWINDSQTYPHAAFIRSLLQQLATSGTICIWSPHERTTLREIAEQLHERNEAPELVQAITELVQGPRLIDLHALAKQYYFHPAMGRSTSLKRVADAIWCSEPALRLQFAQFGLDPANEAGFYAALPAIEVQGQPLQIREGTEAIRAYHMLLYLTDGEERAVWKQLLLEYCRHDTLALVLVWNHWQRMLRLHG